MKDLVNAAIEISMRRRRILASMREALEAGDDESALDLAKRLCGLDDEPKKSDRANSSIN